jgi:hypothetical protein
MGRIALLVALAFIAGCKKSPSRDDGRIESVAVGIGN